MCSSVLWPLLLPSGCQLFFSYLRPTNRRLRWYRLLKTQRGKWLLTGDRRSFLGPTGESADESPSPLPRATTRYEKLAIHRLGMLELTIIFRLL